MTSPTPAARAAGAKRSAVQPEPADDLEASTADDIRTATITAWGAIAPARLEAAYCARASRPQLHAGLQQLAAALSAAFLVLVAFAAAELRTSGVLPLAASLFLLCVAAASWVYAIVAQRVGTLPLAASEACVSMLVVSVVCALFALEYAWQSATLAHPPAAAPGATLQPSAKALCIGLLFLLLPCATRVRPALCAAAGGGAVLLGTVARLVLSPAELIPGRGAEVALHAIIVAAAVHACVRAAANDRERWLLHAQLAESERRLSAGSPAGSPTTTVARASGGAPAVDATRPAAHARDTQRARHEAVLRVAVHDLRDPLLSSAALVASLRALPSSTALSHPTVDLSLDAIASCMHLVEGAVSDLLDAERVGQHGVKLELDTALRFPHLLDLIETAFSAAAQLRRVELAITPPSAELAGRVFEADYAQLQQSVAACVATAVELADVGACVSVSAVLVDDTPAAAADALGGSSSRADGQASENGPGAAEGEAAADGAADGARSAPGGAQAVLLRVQTESSAVGVEDEVSLNTSEPSSSGAQRISALRAASLRLPAARAVLAAHNGSTVRARITLKPPAANARAAAAAAMFDQQMLSGGGAEGGAPVRASLELWLRLAPAKDQGTERRAPPPQELSLLRRGVSRMVTPPPPPSHIEPAGAADARPSAAGGTCRGGGLRASSGGTEEGLLTRATSAPAMPHRAALLGLDPKVAGAVEARARGRLASALRALSASNTERLQASAALERARADAAVPADTPPGTPPRAAFACLHAEDDALLRLALPGQTFERVGGASYEQVVDGKQALLRLLGREGEGRPAFALAVLDQHMPVMDGATCAAEMRALGFAGMIIGMSSEPPGSASRRAFEKSGLDECVDKDWVGLLRLLDVLHALAAGVNPRKPRRSRPVGPSQPPACARPDMFEVAAAKRAFDEAAAAGKFR